MSATVKLHNAGARSIQYAQEMDAHGMVKKTFHFAPNAKIEFPKEIADKLLRLYPDEVQSLDTITKAFGEAEMPKRTKKDDALAV